MVTVKDFTSPIFPTWCPGCGDWGIWAAIKNALVGLNFEPHEVMIVYGVGCSGNMCSFINAYGFHGLHGRAIPVAEAIKIANHKLPVIVVGGDGDLLGEGLSHFITACRGNTDITVVLHDNQVYGLTTGQTAPTADKGYKSKTTPLGSIEIRLNPLVTAITQGATYVARGFAGDPNHLTKLIIDGVQHKGFSFINALQPCVSFNHIHTYPWYRERIYKLEDRGYIAKDSSSAYIKALEWGDHIPLGLFYKEEKDTFQDNLPQIKLKTLVEQDIKNISIEKSYREFI